MYRRLGISLLLVVGLAAVWLFRGGDATVGQSPSSTSAGRSGERPRPRVLGNAVNPDAPPPRPRAREYARPKLERAPIFRAEGDSQQAAADAQQAADDDRMRWEQAELEGMIRTATKDPDPTERAAAIADLALRDDLEKVAPVLQVAAADPDPEVKLAVVAALAQFGEAVPLDLLKQFAADPDPEIRLAALEIVEALSEEDSVPALVEPFLRNAARDPDDEVRDKATEIIDQLSGNEDSGADEE